MSNEVEEGRSGLACPVALGEALGRQQLQEEGARSWGSLGRSSSEAARGFSRWQQLALAFQPMRPMGWRRMRDLVVVKYGAGGG